MAAHCVHCKKPISCGCQKTTAKDGATVCKGCVHVYNASLDAGTTRNNGKK